MTAITEPDHAACDSPECVWCQPTLNTPYEPPERHWKTVDNRTRNQITPERRKARSRMPLGRAPEPTQTDLYTATARLSADFATTCPRGEATSGPAPPRRPRGFLSTGRGQPDRDRTGDSSSLSAKPLRPSCT